MDNNNNDNIIIILGGLFDLFYWSISLIKCVRFVSNMRPFSDVFIFNIGNYFFDFDFFFSCCLSFSFSHSSSHPEVRSRDVRPV